jgi:SPP1 family predicted phage head-tail adaptor
VKAGKLDRRITIQRKTVTLSDSGQPVESWATLATVWAAIMPVRGAESLSAPQISATQLNEFHIRWFSAVADVHPQDRIIYPVGSSAATAVYDIREVHEIGRRDGLKLIAERRPDLI